MSDTSGKALFRILTRITTVLTLALFSHAGFADATECTRGELTRIVAVVYSEPGQPVPCEVVYEKPPQLETQTLWRAVNEAGYCEARAAEFVEKLRDLGWQCDGNQTQPQTEGN